MHFNQSYEEYILSIALLKEELFKIFRIQNPKFFQS